jgi:hypothetical protein
MDAPLSGRNAWSGDEKCGPVAFDQDGGKKDRDKFETC